MKEKELVNKAKEFATKAHTGHFRINPEQTPYTDHLEEVALLVEMSGGDHFEIAAAWLHDVVEDTPATMEDVQREFGEEVAEMVYGLTDLPEFLELSLTERKHKQAERVKTESNGVKRVKIADQASNVKFIGRGDLTKFIPSDYLDYLEGARKIAEACAGISEHLDKTFEAYYRMSKKNLGL